MPIFSKLPGWSFTIIASLLGITGHFFLQRYKIRRDAAASFRKTVLSELEGVYPSTRNWPRDISSKLQNTIDKIESSAKEYEIYLPFYRKKAFHSALNQYLQCCREITWDQCVAFAMYPSLRNPDEISPKEKFTIAVDRLLSFCK